MARMFGKNSKFQKRHHQDSTTQCQNVLEPTSKKYLSLGIKIQTRYYDTFTVKGVTSSLLVSNVHIHT